MSLGFSRMDEETDLIHTAFPQELFREELCYYFQTPIAIKLMHSK